MSDDYLKIVPIEPEFVPDPSTHAAALKLLAELFPDGELCNVEVYDTLQFIDQGGNLESIHCPSCRAVTRVDYLSEDDPGQAFWFETSDLLEDAHASEFIVKMPCCGNDVPFISLSFDWPAAFARFELNILNPDDPRTLNEAELRRFEEILGSRLTQVRAHY